MSKENRIVSETEHFYVYQISHNRFEIRVNRNGYSEALGVTDTREQAQRFIDRAEKYPSKF